MGQINQAVQELDQVIQQNAGTSAEVAVAADGLSRNAQALADAVSSFRTGHEGIPSITSETTTRRAVLVSKTPKRDGYNASLGLTVPRSHVRKGPPTASSGKKGKAHSDEEFESF